MEQHRLPSQQNGQLGKLHSSVDAARQTAPAQESTSARILVVEDDLPLARLLCSWLASEGFVADSAGNAETALAKLEAGEFSLTLLDLNLPGMDGLALLPKLHAARPSMPIMVLTGRSRTEDRVESLNVGADDCLMKPFSLAELLARMRALLRRRPVSSQAAPALVSKKGPGLLLDREEYRVERDGRRIELTPREFALLDFLMRNAPKPVSRATLMEEVWRVPFDPTTNIVDVYMKYLRDKIDMDGEEKLIRTVRGVGYALACA